MSKRSCFRSRFQSQRVYESQTLLKSARQPFYFIVSSSRHRLSWKTSHLVRYKTFGLFVNAVTAYEKYSHHIIWQIFWWQIFLSGRNFRNQFKYNYLKKQIIFDCISTICINFSTMWKKINLKDSVFAKLWTPKNVFT